MTAAIADRVRQATAVASELASGVGAIGPVARAAASLAAVCLEHSAATPGWLASHELVRDQGIRVLREGLVREAAKALLLARAAFERLAVHSHDAKHSEQMRMGLTELADELARLCGGLDRCESELRERIAEPAVAAIDLQQRRASLKASPDARTAQLAELVREVDALRTKREQHDLATEALRRAERGELEKLRALQGEDAQLHADTEALKKEIARRAGEVAELEQKAFDLRQDRDRIDGRLAVVREELEALREDPRDAVRAAVTAALQLLPLDALDRGLGGFRL